MFLIQNLPREMPERILYIDEPETVEIEEKEVGFLSYNISMGCFNLSELKAPICPNFLNLGGLLSVRIKK